MEVGREEGDYFPVKVGLRQENVMLPWLFSIFMDGVVSEVKATVREQVAKMV